MDGLAADDHIKNGLPYEHVKCPTRLLVCSSFKGMEMFEGSAGGPACVPKWKAMIPHVSEAITVESSHVDIPFQPQTKDAVIAL